MAFELSFLMLPQLTKEEGEIFLISVCFISPAALSSEIKNQNGMRTCIFASRDSDETFCCCFCNDFENWLSILERKRYLVTVGFCCCFPYPNSNFYPTTKEIEI